MIFVRNLNVNTSSTYSSYLRWSTQKIAKVHTQRVFKWNNFNWLIFLTNINPNQIWKCSFCGREWFQLEPNKMQNKPNTPKWILCHHSSTNSAPFLKKQNQKIKENQYSFYRKNHSLKQKCIRSKKNPKTQRS